MCLSIIDYETILKKLYRNFSLVLESLMTKLTYINCHEVKNHEFKLAFYRINCSFKLLPFEMYLRDFHTGVLMYQFFIFIFRF